MMMLWLNLPLHIMAQLTPMSAHWRTGGGGGGAWGRPPPLQIKFNHGLFSMYRQNIERNSSLRM